MNEKTGGQITNETESKKLRPASLVMLGYIYVAAWAFLVIFILETLVIIGLKLANFKLDFHFLFFLWSILALLILLPVVLIYALSFKCPNCNGYCTIQTFRPLSVNIKPYGGLTGWGGTVARIVFEKLFRCMYCDYEESLEKIKS